MLIVKLKKKILKGAREKMLYIYKIKSDISSETMKAEDNGTRSFKCQKKNTCNLESINYKNILHKLR